MFKKNKEVIKESKPEIIDGTYENEALREEAITSPSKAVVKRFFANKLGVIGLIGFLAIVLVVFIGSALLKYDPYYQQGVMMNIGTGSGYMKVPAGMKEEGIKKISTGVTFSIGLSNEKKFYVWGYSDDILKKIPQEAIDAQGKIKDVAAGDKHVLILTEDNKIIGWGNNTHGQAEEPTDAKVKMAVKSDGGIKAIAAGDLYSLLITNEGTLRAWGATLPSGLNRISTRYDKMVEEVEPASINVLVRTKDGKVVLFGKKGSEIDTEMPDEIKFGEGTANIVEIGRMRYSAVAIDDQGKIYKWGSVKDNINSMPEIDGKIVKAESGREHLAVLTDKGKVYAWGTDNYGTLKGIPSGDGYKDLFVGFFNNYAIKEDGGIDTWGLDGFTMGSDQQGRDLFTRLVNGGRMTLLIALVAVAIQVILGVLVGVIAGFYGGRVDNFLMRFSEIIASFPFYPLIITLSSILPPGASQYQRLIMIMVILGILGWTGIARLVRGEILSERQKDYIMAAKALGLKESKIMMSHMVPNIISIIIVQATLGYAASLLTEAGLSFLGFGVQDPFPSWGNMLNSASEVSVIEDYWWRWVFPGLAVFLTALTVNLIGDALRDAMDPKAQER